jgi:serine/threonine protein phosphatase PrpC
MAPETDSHATILARLEMKSSDERALGPGVAAWFSAVSPEKDTPNEDGLAVIEIDEHRAVLAVADGLGGRPGGAEAAETALAALADAIALREPAEAPLQPSIMAGFERGNEAVMALGIGAGATLVAVEIDGANARSYHVGDSLALIVGQRGRRKHETIGHSPVAYALEAGMLSQQEAMHHHQRHIVSNILGSTDMRIEVGPQMTLAIRDTVLLASDGLFDNLHLREIVELMRRGPIGDCCARLAEAARNRMRNTRTDQPSKPDDLSIILFRLHGRTVSHAAAPEPDSTPRQAPNSNP